MDFREEKKVKYSKTKSIKSPGKNLRTIPVKESKSKKKFNQSAYEFKEQQKSNNQHNNNLKTEGSFDSTSSCMFINEV